ncbi:MAG: hypothetical protein QOD92_3146 [Acidimicrobiaceae bacterium]
MPLLLATAPVATAVLTLIGQRWTPTGDQALEVLRVRDVGGPHGTLVGAYSRWGWAHPGPLLFWQLAPFDIAFGDLGVLLGVGLANLVATAGIVAVCFRRGGTALASLGALVVLLLVRSFGMDLLVDPWNPYVALLPFFLMIVLVWSTLCDDLIALPLAVVLGSYLIQTHVGYLPMAAGLIAVGFTVAVARAWRAYTSADDVQSMQDDAPASRRVLWLAVAALVGLNLWLPPVVQQFTGDDPNLSALVSYANDSKEPRLGWSEGFGEMGEQIRLDGSWITGKNPFVMATSSTVGATLLLAALAALAVVLRRRRRDDAAWLSVTAIVAVGLGVATTAGVTGAPWFFVLRWWWVLGAVASLALAWAILSLLPARVVRRCGLVCAAISVPFALVVVLDGPVDVPDANLSHAMGDLGSQTASAIPRDHRYLVRAAPQERGLFIGGLERGLFVELERRGFSVYVDVASLGDLTYGSWRMAREVDVDDVLLLVPTISSDSRFDPPTGARLITSWDPLSKEERDRARALESRIRSSVRNALPPGAIVLDDPVVRYEVGAAGAPASDVQQLLTLQQRGDRYDVYMVPSTHSG